MNDAPGPERRGRAGAWLDLWRERLTPRRAGKLALGLAIGAAGGFAAEWLHVPLAPMPGSSPCITSSGSSAS